MNIYKQKCTDEEQKKDKKTKKTTESKRGSDILYTRKSLENTHAYFDIHTNNAVEIYTASWDYWWSVFFQLTWWLGFLYE